MKCISQDTGFRSSGFQGTSIVQNDKELSLTYEREGEGEMDL